MERGKSQLQEQYGSTWRRWSAIGVLACALVMCTTVAFGQDSADVGAATTQAQDGMRIAQKPAFGIGKGVGPRRGSGEPIRRTPAVTGRLGLPRVAPGPRLAPRGAVWPGRLGIGTATPAPMTLRIHGLGPTGVTVARALSYKWSAEGTRYRSGISTGGTTRVVPGRHKPLEVVKLIDSVTPELRLTCWSPRVFDKVELQYSSPQLGGGRIAVTITLTSAAILKLEETGPDPAGWMTERVSFIYRSIEWVTRDASGRVRRVGSNPKTNVGGAMKIIR